MRLNAETVRSYREEYRSLVKLGLPVLVTQVGIILVSFADTMMVGAYGLDELAAAAFVNNFFMVPVVMLIGFAAGMTPLVGALFSMGRRREAGRTLRAGLQVNVAVAVVFMAVMGALYMIVGSFGQDEELLPLVRPYYLLVLATMLPNAVFNCCQQTFNGCNDTSTPMWIILGADVLNVVGNYVLIFGKFGFPELGLLGAGISTLVARLAGAVTIVGIFLWSPRWRDYAGGLRGGSGCRSVRRKVWVTSYPVMIQSGVECFLWSFGAVVCGWFGKVQLAAYQVVNTIGQLGFMTYMSFGVAVSVNVANCTGLNDASGIERNARAGLHLNLVLCVVACLIFVFGGSRLVHLFTPSDAVTASAMGLLVPLLLYQFGDAIQLTYASALRGTSVVKPLLWISLISYFGAGVPSLLLLAVTAGLGNLGAYVSFNIALFTASVLMWLAFRRALQDKRMEFAAKSRT